MFDKRRPKIVAFGGGTGLSVLLKGLKDYPVDLTAVVTVTDDGGSSGEMIRIFNMPPPGDLRKVLVSLSRNEELFEELFNYRFSSELQNEFSGHTIGNIILAALQDINDGDFSDAITDLSHILNIQGTVIPIADEKITLCAEYEDGSIIAGESKISKHGKRIKRVFLKENHIQVNEEVLDAIYSADLVLFSQGSLFTSLIPNLLFKEVVDALKGSDAHIMYIANVMTQAGETKDFMVCDHIRALEAHIGKGVIDTVIYNDNLDVEEKYLDNYRKLNSDIVYFDREKLSEFDYNFFPSRVVMVDQKGRVRHNYRKLAANIFSVLIGLSDE